MDTSEPGYAQATRVRALGPSRANPWAPRRRRVTVSLENEGDSGLGCSDHHDGGWDPQISQISRLPFLCSTPDGLGHRNGPLVGGLISNILFFQVMYGEVVSGRCQCATSIYYYSYIYRASRGISGVGVTITLLCPRSMPA